MKFARNAPKSLKSNKAVRLNKLSACLLKDACDVIAPILTGLINKSFTDGVFPEVWKCAKVTALFKDGDKSLKDNYRPISILPTISKIIERSAHIQLRGSLPNSLPKSYSGSTVEYLFCRLNPNPESKEDLRENISKVAT